MSTGHKKSNIILSANSKDNVDFPFAPLPTLGRSQHTWTVFLNELSMLFKPYTLLQIAAVSCKVILIESVGIFPALNILPLVLARSA